MTLKIDIVVAHIYFDREKNDYISLKRANSNVVNIFTLEFIPWILMNKNVRGFHPES